MESLKELQPMFARSFRIYCQIVPSVSFALFSSFFIQPKKMRKIAIAIVIIIIITATT